MSDSSTGLPILRLDRCSFAYLNDKHTLDSISLSFEKPEVVMIYGANGSGKSTLLKLIRGLVIPQHGTISFRSFELSRIDSIRLSPSYLVFTNPDQTFLGYTVREDLSFVHRHRPEAIIAAIQMFEQLDCAHLIDRPISQLSHGQQKILSIGIGLASELPVLLFDEPFAFLEMSARQNLVRVLQQSAGHTLILVTAQEPSLETFLISDRTVVLDHRVIYDGSTSELLRSPNRIRETYLERDPTVRLICRVLQTHAALDLTETSVFELLEHHLTDTHSNEAIEKA